MVKLAAFAAFETDSPVLLSLSTNRMFSFTNSSPASNFFNKSIQSEIFFRNIELLLNILYIERLERSVSELMKNVIEIVSGYRDRCRNETARGLGSGIFKVNNAHIYNV